MKNGVNIVRYSGPRTKNYSICRQAFFSNMKECIRETENIYARMRNLAKKNDKYKDISFVVGASQTKGNTAQKMKFKTNGRTKYVIRGEKVKPHIHIACYGYLAPSFVSEITKKLNKNIYKTKKDYINRGYKHKLLYTLKKLNLEANDLYYISYIWRQSERFLSYGNLNFDELKKADFIVYDETVL